MIKAFLRTRLQDLRAGFLTRPGREDVGYCVVVLLAYLLTALPFGYLTGFMTPSPLGGDLRRLALLPISLFIMPSLLEEAFFRGLMLPHRQWRLPPARRRLSAVTSVAAFVAWHPLNAATINPAAYPVFTDPVFLVLVALLGTACTLTYLKTGSIWVPVFIHWLTVVVWVYFFSGRNLVLDLV
jgi:predicted Abi (CAAX) family protease